MKRSAPIRRSPIKRKPPKPRPGADPDYIAWLHSQACAVATAAHDRLTPALARIEAAHVGIRGLSQKCPDREAIPLCTYHHREGPSAHHTLGKRFWSFHGLDRDELLQVYNARFEMHQERVSGGR